VHKQRKRKKGTLANQEEEFEKSLSKAVIYLIERFLCFLLCFAARQLRTVTWVTSAVARQPTPTSQNGHFGVGASRRPVHRSLWILRFHFLSLSSAISTLLCCPTALNGHLGVIGDSPTAGANSRERALRSPTIGLFSLCIFLISDFLVIPLLIQLLL